MSSTFWHEFRVKARTSQVVERVQSILKEQHLSVSVKSGGVFGKEKPDDWIVLNILPNNADGHPMKDLGLKAIERLKEILSIDTGWLVKIPRGISWWAGSYQQRLWSEEAFKNKDGTQIWKLHVETDFLRSCQPSTKKLIMATLPFASMYAFVLDTNSGKLQMHSTAYVYEENFEFVIHEVATSAVLQLADAQFKAKQLAPLLEGEPDISPHPTAGIRTVPDEILQVVQAIYVPRGQGISAWADNPEFESAAEFFNRFNAIGTADRSGLTLEFPFGERTSMLRVTTTFRFLVR